MLSGLNRLAPKGGAAARESMKRGITGLQDKYRCSCLAPGLPPRQPPISEGLRKLGFARGLQGTRGRPALRSAPTCPSPTPATLDPGLRDRSRQQTHGAVRGLGTLPANLWRYPGPTPAQMHRPRKDFTGIEYRKSHNCSFVCALAQL